MKSTGTPQEIYSFSRIGGVNRSTLELSGLKMPTADLRVLEISLLKLFKAEL